VLGPAPRGDTDDEVPRESDTVVAVVQSAGGRVLVGGVDGGEEVAHGMDVVGGCQGHYAEIAWSRVACVFAVE
jgi:hypothetical protein